MCVVVAYVTAERKKTRNLCCKRNFLFLLSLLQDFVWCWGYIIKQIFHAHFCLIPKLSTVGKVMFNTNNLG